MEATEEAVEIVVTFSVVRRGAECFVAGYSKIFHIR